jgi:hypothetical protein
VMKFDGEGHVRMVFGRYRKPGDSVPPPHPARAACAIPTCCCSTGPPTSPSRPTAIST